MVLLHSLYFQSLEILHKYESRGEAILNIGLDFGDDITANNLKKATTKNVSGLYRNADTISVRCIITFL